MVASKGVEGVPKGWVGSTTVLALPSRSLPVNDSRGTTRLPYLYSRRTGDGEGAPRLGDSGNGGRDDVLRKTPEGNTLFLLPDGWRVEVGGRSPRPRRLNLGSTRDY